jgi:hypothetical protein
MEIEPERAVEILHQWSRENRDVAVAIMIEAKLVIHISKDRIIFEDGQFFYEYAGVSILISPEAFGRCQHIVTTSNIEGLEFSDPDEKSRLVVARSSGDRQVRVRELSNWTN